MEDKKTPEDISFTEVKGDKKETKIPSGPSEPEKKKFSFSNYNSWSWWVWAIVVVILLVIASYLFGDTNSSSSSFFSGCNSPKKTEKTPAPVSVDTATVACIDCPASEDQELRDEIRRMHDIVVREKELDRQKAEIGEYFGKKRGCKSSNSNSSVRTRTIVKKIYLRGGVGETNVVPPAPTKPCGSGKTISHGGYLYYEYHGEESPAISIGVFKKGFLRGIDHEWYFSESASKSKIKAVILDDRSYDNVGEGGKLPSERRSGSTINTRFIDGNEYYLYDYPNVEKVSPFGNDPATGEYRLRPDFRQIDGKYWRIK